MGTGSECWLTMYRSLTPTITWWGLGALMVLLILGSAGRAGSGQALANGGFVLLARAFLPDPPAAHGQQAIGYFERSAERMGAVSPQLARGLGMAALQRKDLAQAERYFRQAGLNGFDLIAFGQQSVSVDQLETARLWYDTATSLAPHLADGWYYLGRSFLDAGSYPQAQEALERGMQAQVLGDIGRADISFLLGESERLGGKKNQAAAHYRSALQGNDFAFSYNHVHALDQLAAIHMDLQEYAQAIEYLRKAIVLSPDFDWPHIRLGVALYGCCADYAGAIEEIQRGVQLNPQNAWGYIHLGDIHAAEGKTAAAKDAYSHAKTLRPDWPLPQIRISELQSQ